ncbi:P-loop NTPase family protein [Crenalkalicoccus roseus]|uniref:hypothetical protein n=1 Tax=Crenalkalicoccus roseus TaxID=1485588 RepID=UPI00108009AE|nr:hypothetical protein [Crenalkalicoccus roseus]
MTYTPTPRPHLVERAVEALGGTALLRQPSHGAAAPAPPPRAPAPAEPAAAPLPPPSPAIGWEALRRAGLAIGEPEAARSRLSEEINIVQQQLLLAMRKIEPSAERCARAVLVTSARPGEGKTFTALNLAASLAASNVSPVVLVDTDGKRDSISAQLGQAEAPGLRLLASRRAPPPASLVLATARPGLFFLPHGAPVEGEPAVPPGPMVAAAILRLAAALPDHILILDSPPCLATSEPNSLAAVVGQVLMVVEAERTQRDEVEAALDLVDACPNLQLLLNRMQLSASDSFGAYGGYDAYGAPAPRPGG